MNYHAYIDKRNGYYCKLKNGKTLPIAKRRQEAFNKFLRLKI
jgi:two-component system LytT family response regulator